uniref:Uncharacterized protein n=1 Tax=Ditylenchus dipsaci TaxID=166011 RepID=A0A915D5F4_9BILA
MKEEILSFRLVYNLSSEIRISLISYEIKISQQAKNQIAAAAAERAKAARNIRLARSNQQVQKSEAVWYATGDMKILSALYGHMGSASTHSCLMCEAPKETFRSNKGSSARTLYSIELAWRNYLCFFRSGTKANGGKKTRKNAAAGEKKKLDKQMDKITKFFDDRMNKSSCNVISR